MRKVCLLCNNQKIEQRLRPFLEEQGLTIEPFRPDMPACQEYDVVLIVEPYFVKGESLSIFSVWKRYLADKAQNTKLLVAGFKEVEHANYINLLKFYEDFNWEKIYSNALLATETWKGTDTIQGNMDILSRLNLFFKGHNHESIIDCITIVRANLNNAHLSFHGSEQLERKKQPFEAIWKDIMVPGRANLRRFYHRWQNYSGYFNCMPFIFQLSRIHAFEFIEALNKLYTGRVNRISKGELDQKEKDYIELDAFNRIGKLTQTLKSINKKYIDPDHIAQILLIDDDNDFHKQMKASFPDINFHSSYNAREAQIAISVYKVDIILLDLQLNPDDDEYLEGVDLIPYFKTAIPDTPLVIVSTYSKESIIRRTLSNGANFFLSKSTFDIGHWNNIFLKLKGEHNFSLQEVLDFNAVDNSGGLPQILVVDDELKWVEKIKGLSNRYTFIPAYTIRQAEDRLFKNKEIYDLILLDLYFDGKKEGQDLVPKIKEVSPDLPVVLFTVEEKDKDMIEAFGKGADFYLRKTEFNTVLWLKVIELLINQKKLKDQLQA